MPVPSICFSDYVPAVPAISAVLRDQDATAADRGEASERRGNAAQALIETTNDLAEKVAELAGGVQRLVEACKESPPNNLEEVVEELEDAEARLASELQAARRRRRTAFRHRNATPEERRLVALSIDGLVKAERAAAIAARDGKWELAALLAENEAEDGPIFESAEDLEAHLASL